MRTIRHDGEHEIEVRRSRFLCALGRAGDEERARAFIAARRSEHWNATHNCTAYVLGPDGEIQRSSDDGEPSGTAGVPMLEMLRHRELTDTVAVVTRYFGGVKLGAGGLVRAYGAAVRAAVDAVGVLERHTLQVVRVRGDYALGGRLESELHGSGHTVLEVRYDAEVVADVAVAEADLAEFTSWLAARTGGVARSEVVGSRVIEREPRTTPRSPRPPGS